jgi:hypothetical protein
MSIIITIASLEAQGKLFGYEPFRTSKPARRRLFLTAHMKQNLENPSSAVNALVGRGHIEAALTLWTVGDHIYNDGRKKPQGGFLKRLDAPPPEVWEIRVTNPTPQARILGRFAGPDTFIATGMYTRSFLGKKGSTGWTTASADCLSEWNKILPNFAPFSGSAVADYVTENCDDFAL